MSNPWTITGTPTRIAVPALAWERRGGVEVNEGPAVIQRNGRLFLTSSASATDANYCLGLLTASAGSNLLSASSWTKTPDPVFASNAGTGQYGPGHNSFTTSEDGQGDILVYHDRNYPNITGDPLKSANLPDRFVRHWEYRARVEATVKPLADSQFRLVPGLAGGGSVSLESTNFPGYCLRHSNFEGWVRRNDGTATFRADASFTRRAGLTGSGTVSFESVNFPGRYLRHYENAVFVQAVSTATERADATFILE